MTMSRRQKGVNIGGGAFAALKGCATEETSNLPTSKFPTLWELVVAELEVLAVAQRFSAASATNSSTRARNAGSRWRRSSCVMRNERVSREKVNCTGSLRI